MKHSLFIPTTKGWAIACGTALRPLRGSAASRLRASIASTIAAYSANGMETGLELRAALPGTQDRPSQTLGRSYAPSDGWSGVRTPAALPTFLTDDEEGCSTFFREIGPVVTRYVTAFCLAVAAFSVVYFAWQFVR